MISEKLQKKLEKLLNKVPKGKVTTYGALARSLRVHPRAVGIMLSKNDPRKAPCYKVIGSGGRIGGYSGGIKRKIRLLKKDGIEIRKNKVDLDRIIS